MFYRPNLNKPEIKKKGKFIFRYFDLYIFQVRVIFAYKLIYLYISNRIVCDWFIF